MTASGKPRSGVLCAEMMDGFDFVPGRPAIRLIGSGSLPMSPAAGGGSTPTGRIGGDVSDDNIIDPPETIEDRLVELEGQIERLRAQLAERTEERDILGLHNARLLSDKIERDAALEWASDNWLGQVEPLEGPTTFLERYRAAHPERTEESSDG